MKGLSLEAKVGLLILAAALLLGTFLFVLGGVRLSSGYDVFVDFDNPGSVQTGAPVRIAGMKVGSIQEVTYRGGRLDPTTGRRSLVRMRLRIDDDVRETIHDDALFYVTAQGVLGEQFIAIDPGTPSKPVLREGAIMHGVDPPRLDLALALGYELLDTLVKTIRDNREELTGMLTNIADILRSLSGILHDNRGRIDRIIANVETATTEVNELVHGVRTQYVDGAEVRRILRNLDRTLGAVATDIRPILDDVRTTVRGANDALSTLGPDERTRIQGAIRDAAELADRANRTIGDAQQIVAHIREGRGTVGALVMDEEIYDDLQELLRDLRHNPWKFFWRE